jgi:ribonuclease-3
VNADKFLALTGYQFRQQELLQQALTHRSFSRSSNNERLEFLGDSVLNLIISNHIYRRFSDADEGDLSRIRASLVKQSTLAQVAREINLGDYINLGGGELKSGGFRRASILSDALEAVIGAIYLRLQEYLQARQRDLPLYEIESTTGKSHSQLFTVSCRIEEPALQALGSGTSRKQAEQQAAQKLLDELDL